MSQVLVEGEAVGELLVLEEPLSFWGGVDPVSGRIIDVAHPQVGDLVTGKIIAMAHGRGSSSAATVIAETIRNGSGPAGILLETSDEILVAGVFVANALYGTRVPIVVGPLPSTLDGTFTLDSEGCRPVDSD